MNKTLLLATASVISLGTTVLFSPSVNAGEVDCVNYWVNPENGMLQCFDSNLNYIATPAYHSAIADVNSEDWLSRRSTSLDMVMPDLIGKQIDFAEDYLLTMGVTLGSKSVHTQNASPGAIVQQTPAPGTNLNKGQTVQLHYMGAVVSPEQIK